MSCSLKDDATDVRRSPSMSDSRLETNCSIQDDRFDFILSQNIETELRCVQRNLEIFLSIIEPDSPETEGMLSRRSLEGFIRKNSPELVGVLPYFDFFFDLSHLIFGDPLNYLTEVNLAQLTELMVIFNREVSAIHSLLDHYQDEVSPAVHEENRQRIISSAQSVTQYLGRVLRGNQQVSTQISLLRIIETFQTDTNQTSIKKISSLLFVKRLIAGGDAHGLLQQELADFTAKLPGLMGLFYDVLKISYIDFNNELQRYRTFQNVLTQLERSLYQGVSMDDIAIADTSVKGAIDAFKDDLGLETPDLYYDALDSVREIFTGDKRNITFAGLYQLIAHGQDIISQALTYAQGFFDYELDFLSPSPLDTFEFLNPFDPSSEILSYREYEQFIATTRSFRYYLGDAPAPYFGNVFRRNEKGLIEISLYQAIGEIVFRFYEHKYPCDDSRFIKNINGELRDLRCEEGEDYEGTLNAYQLEEIIEELKAPLIDLKIVTPGLEILTAENAYLMTDLFQLQSNNNGLIEVNEAVEFALQIITAKKMEDHIMESMDQFCHATTYKLFGEETKTYPVTCFRRHFFDVLQLTTSNQNNDHFRYSDYLPRLMQFHKHNETDEMIKQLELFARTCAEDDIPMRANDIVSVFGGLFNIESTITRFDQNLSNQMDPHEVDFAYDQHFEPAIINIVRRIDPNGEPFAKSVFKFLIKNRRIPSTTELITYHFFGNKNNPADRTTIASVLATIKTQSEHLHLSQAYCEELRAEFNKN